MMNITWKKNLFYHLSGPGFRTAARHVTNIFLRINTIGGPRNLLQILFSISYKTDLVAFVCAARGARENIFTSEGTLVLKDNVPNPGLLVQYGLHENELSEGIINDLKKQLEPAVGCILLEQITIKRSLGWNVTAQTLYRSHRKVYGYQRICSRRDFSV